MSPPTRQDRQQIAFANAAHLLSQPAPEVHAWTTTDGSALHGALSPLDNLDATRLALHQWAAILHEPEWDLRLYSTSGSLARLSVAGNWGTLWVQIWNDVPVQPGIGEAALLDMLAELSAPPSVDSTGEGPAEPDALEVARSASLDARRAGLGGDDQLRAILAAVGVTEGSGR